MELSTKDGIVCVPWLKIRKVLRQGDFVEVTGGMYLGHTGWVSELEELHGSTDDDVRFITQVAKIIKIEDKEKPLSDRTQVFPIMFEFSALDLIYPSDNRRVRQFIKACCCSSRPWKAPAGQGCYGMV